MFKKAAVNSEEFIFYIDLLSDYLKKKVLTKAIISFIKDKDKFNSLSSYGLVLFQKKGAPITTYDEKEADSLIHILDEYWGGRETQKSYLENGLFEILSYVFRKIRTARKNYRVIIISDTPSSLSEEYHNALYDLLLKARKFDTFIDIIRVGDQKFYEDDVKLKVIVSETHGGVFYCNDIKLFQNILGSLIQNKTEFNVIQTDETEYILEEDKVFYERLAVDLISLDAEEEEKCDICEQELCPICEAYSDEVHKCFNCNARYHSCCAAEYSIANNIGFKHLFRCVQCDTLLKLDEEFVNLIYQENHPEEFEEISEETMLIEIPSEEEYSGVDEITDDYDKAYSEEEIELEAVHVESEAPSLKKVRIGGFFGTEITIPSKNNDKPKIIDPIPNTTINVAENSDDSTLTQKKISITSLRPPKKKTINLCRICGTTLRNAIICPNCGAKVD
ncbi:MAG: hypothetical protein ACFE78_04180 [Candidatus Hodarchaeota archaeon]